MQPEDDARLGTPPEARHPERDSDKPPHMAMGLMIGLIAGCAAAVALLLWLFGSVPGSG